MEKPHQVFLSVTDIAIKEEFLEENLPDEDEVFIHCFFCPPHVYFFCDTYLRQSWGYNFLAPGKLNEI